MLEITVTLPVFSIKERNGCSPSTLDCFYHISHYLRPGSVRIAHSVYTDKIESVAYKNTDGSIILVLLNRTEKQLPVNLRLHGQTRTLNVLPQSVTTCTIEYE